VTEAGTLRELREAAGASSVLEHESLGVDGANVALTLAPSSRDDLAATLAVCTRHELPLLVRGGGTRLGVGNRPRPVEAWLSTAALEPCCEVDADEGVARVAAATPLRELATAAIEAGWRSPLEASGPLATLGGSLAIGSPGPRALGFGPPRRTVLGLEVVLASGERTRCGSRVVKNVSGYDLAKLYVGSLGTLGVLTEAWLRLGPRPEAERTLSAQVGERGVELARRAARRPGARAVALVDGRFVERSPADEAPDVLLVDLAGDAPVVDQTEAWLRSEADVSPRPDAIDWLQALQEEPGSGALHFRASSVPSRLGPLRERLHQAGAGVVLHPGLGQAWAFFELEHHDAGLVDDAWCAVRRALDPASGAHAVLEQAPSWAKVGRDVFDARPATLPLMRALKERFDPAGILNPGRFAGGL